jgi:hypothetical protein
VGAVVAITNPTISGLIKELEPGDCFEFGRDVGGVGRISEMNGVSRLHGRIDAVVDGYTVTSLGTHVGFVVADWTTPSRLHVPRGSGPVVVPFAEASIIVELDSGRDHLDVTVEGSTTADRWRDGWAPDMRARWADAGEQVLPLTAAPMSRVKWMKSNGKPYSWFLTLVAMCTLTLSDGRGGTPTNKQLAAIRILPVGVIERHVTEIYDAFTHSPADGNRDAIVALAVSSGLVTRTDLDLL